MADNSAGGAYVPGSSYTPTTNAVTTYVSPLFGRVNGMQKFFNRPTTDAFALQVKTEFTSTNASHTPVESTVDWKAAGTTGGGVRGLQGVARLASGYTATAGSIIGTYGQFSTSGVLNGSGIFGAGLYGLIENGGTYTAVGHVAACWLDSHLSQTVSAGHTSFAYITNNGSTTFEQVFYIYGGNKITAWASFDTCGGMVDTGGTLGGTLKKIRINIDGSPYYLIAGTTVT